MSNVIKKNMSLLIVALLDDSYLDDIILGMTTVSGGQVTMVDAVSGTQNLSQAIPMFAEFVGMSGKRFCKMLVTCVSDPEPAKLLLDALDEGGLDFVDVGIGEIYSLPLAEAVVIEEVDFF
ncbi:MAG: hypothetical protein J7M24_00890 [Candidatus Latescibacteria bacterium]|nr:hypothetical protein [Candidatus Latescibacterota bacterium]